jgi:putative NIF3 family GTP cyclohydrolase 1 type 2
MNPRKKLRVRDIAKFIEEEIAPLKYCLQDDRNGLEFGTLDGKVESVITCWSPTSSVIEKAVSYDANLIVSHEWLFYAYTGNKWLENEAWTFAKQVNLRRLHLLSQSNVCVLKYHSNWDMAPGGTADSFGEFLGFKNLVQKGKLIRVYEEKPISLKKLGDLVANKLEMARVEVSGNLNKKVKYIGTAIGGLGQILTYSDDFTHSQAEVLIFGEMLEYTKIYTRESGYSYIATSHEKSEMPGMLKLTTTLRERFPQIVINCLKSDGTKVEKN